MMFELYKALPKVAKVTVWVCLAHFWILVCAIAYVELEGFSNEGSGHVIIDESELALEILSKTNANINNVKSSPAIPKKRFQELYSKQLPTLKYWKTRNEFNDVSKSYVFVLLAHTKIGAGTMILQTWQSQLFYIFTMPIGTLLYLVMIHTIVADLFEIIAFTAVSIFQNPRIGWTVDQRDLYEKCKVFVISSLYMVAGIFMFGTLGILTTGSYTKGVYYVINLVFAVNCSNQLFAFSEYNHKVIATVLTFLVFFCLLLLYTVTYSVFIMFRYNSLGDLIGVLFGYNDEMNDVLTNNDQLEYDNEHPEEYFVLHPEIDTARVQPTLQQRSNYYKLNYRSSSSGEDPMSSDESYRSERITPLKIVTKQSLVQPKNHLESNTPNIMISSPTPPANTNTEDPFTRVALSKFSDITDIQSTGEKDGKTNILN